MVHQNLCQTKSIHLRIVKLRHMKQLTIARMDKLTSKARDTREQRFDQLKTGQVFAAPTVVPTVQAETRKEEMATNLR